MANSPRVFLDTSALFAGIWSAQGGARMILKLGEASVVQLVISRQVLEEIENAIRRKIPSSLGVLALLLDRSRVEISAAQGDISHIQSFISHPGDAYVLASALDSNVDYFVTLDRKHFLDNSALKGSIPFPMGAPGDFLTWFRSILQDTSRAK